MRFVLALILGVGFAKTAYSEDCAVPASVSVQVSPGLLEQENGSDWQTLFQLNQEALDLEHRFQCEEGGAAAVAKAYLNGQRTRFDGEIGSLRNRIVGFIESAALFSEGNPNNFYGYFDAGQLGLDFSRNLSLWRRESSEAVRSPEIVWSGLFMQLMLERLVLLTTHFEEHIANRFLPLRFRIMDSAFYVPEADLQNCVKQFAIPVDSPRPQIGQFCRTHMRSLKLMRFLKETFEGVRFSTSPGVSFEFISDKWVQNVGLWSKKNTTTAFKELDFNLSDKDHTMSHEAGLSPVDLTLRRLKMEQP